MATAVKLSDEAPFPAPRRLVGALAAGVVIASGANAVERIRVVGLGALRVRAKPASVTGTLTLQIYPVLSDALDTSSTGTRATTNLPAAASTTSATEVSQDYVLAGEQYVDVRLSVSGGGSDTATLAYVDLFAYPDATARPLMDATGAAAVGGAGINVAASAYYNAAVSADVDAAVSAVAGLRLVGFAVRETAGATASFALVNGATGAAAGKVYPVNLAANESTSEWLHPGIACASGISIDWISGAFAIALHYAAVV
jgi:hypothetical protein